MYFMVCPRPQNIIEMPIICHNNVLFHHKYITQNIHWIGEHSCSYLVIFDRKTIVSVSTVDALFNQNNEPPCAWVI